MCIALLSNQHSKYALIVLNNRDEYLTRPTAEAEWWESPNAHVLGGRDLLRPERGTWLGITKGGRLAVLTNFREQGAVKTEAKSRGAMVNAVLTQPLGEEEDTETLVKHLVEGENALKGVGGFSLVCGKVGEPLAVVSNRTPSAKDVIWITKSEDETIGLSNALISDRGWPKVTDGEQLLRSAIVSSEKLDEPKDDLIQRLFDVLSDCRLPKRPVTGKEARWEIYIKELRKSIFLPALGGQGMDGTSSEDIAAAQSNQELSNTTQPRADGLSGIYGTQKQTVILVDHQGHVTFLERTLYDQSGQRIRPGDGERRFEFDIDSWDHSKSHSSFDR